MQLYVARAAWALESVRRVSVRHSSEGTGIVVVCCIVHVVVHCPNFVGVSASGTGSLVFLSIHTILLDDSSN